MKVGVKLAYKYPWNQIGGVLNMTSGYVIHEVASSIA